MANIKNVKGYKEIDAIVMDCYKDVNKGRVGKWQLDCLYDVLCMMSRSYCPRQEYSFEQPMKSCEYLKRREDNE